MIISRTFSVCNVSWYIEREKRHHLYFASNVQVYNSIMRWGEVRDCVLQNNCDWKTSFTLAFDIGDKTNVKDVFQSSVFQSWGTQFIAMNYESCFLPSFVDLFVRHLLSLSRGNYSHNDIKMVLLILLPVKTWFSMGKARYYKKEFTSGLLFGYSLWMVIYEKRTWLEAKYACGWAKLQFMVWGSRGSRGSQGSQGSQDSQGSQGAPEG